MPNRHSSCNARPDHTCGSPAGQTDSPPSLNHWSSSGAIARRFVTAPIESKARLSRRCGPPDQPTRTAFRSQNFASCEHNLRPTQRKLIARTRRSEAHSAPIHVCGRELVVYSPWRAIGEMVRRAVHAGTARSGAFNAKAVTRCATRSPTEGDCHGKKCWRKDQSVLDPRHGRLDFGHDLRSG